MLQSLYPFVTALHKQGVDAFLAANPNPVIVVEPFAETRGKFQTVSSDAGEGTATGVAQVCKREGANAFGIMVTIGRASNNDIVIRAPDVSKFHAYLRQDGDRWTITDAGSRFGTTLGEATKLGKDQSAPLTSGTRLSLGTVKATFLSPEDFVRYLKPSE